MASQEEKDFITLIKEKISTAKFADGMQSFNFCRAKFNCTASAGYTFNMFLRISEGTDGFLSVTLDFPKSTQAIRSDHEFFKKLQARIIALCGDTVEGDGEESVSKFRYSLPSEFD